MIRLIDAGTPCPADLDGSGGVGFGDVLRVIGAWGPCPSLCPEDLDGSGDVGFGDVIELLSNWGTDGPGAELAEPFDVVNFADLLALLGDWGPCGPEGAPEPPAGTLASLARGSAPKAK